MASPVKHGVSFAHAEQALRDEFAATIRDPDHHDEQLFYAGQGRNWANTCGVSHAARRADAIDICSQSKS
jgi:uncharacterized DUF497 family protein